MHELELKNLDEWRQYIYEELKHLPKKLDNIPNSLNFVYKDDGCKMTYISKQKNLLIGINT